MTTPQSRSDAGLATSLRISVSRLARRMRIERVAQGLQPELSDSQLAALAASGRTNHKIADRLVITASTIEYVAQSHN